MHKSPSEAPTTTPSSVAERVLQFAQLFDYTEPNDRAIVIVGSAFLDALLTDMLTNFLVDDAKEVRRLVQPEGALGSFGARISACYCLGLIGETIQSDLRLIAKVRNRFAHEVDIHFTDPRIQGWCESLRWHRFSMMADPPSEATARDVFQVGVNQLVTYLHGFVGVARLERRPTCQHGVVF